MGILKINWNILAIYIRKLFMKEGIKKYLLFSHFSTDHKIDLNHCLFYKTLPSVLHLPHDIPT